MLSYPHATEKTVASTYLSIICSSLQQIWDIKVDHFAHSEQYEMKSCHRDVSLESPHMQIYVQLYWIREIHVHEVKT